MLGRNVTDVWRKTESGMRNTNARCTSFRNKYKGPVKRIREANGGWGWRKVMSWQGQVRVEKYEHSLHHSWRYDSYGAKPAERD